MSWQTLTILTTKAHACQTSSGTTLPLDKISSIQFNSIDVCVNVATIGRLHAQQQKCHRISAALLVCGIMIFMQVIYMYTLQLHNHVHLYEYTHRIRKMKLSIVLLTVFCYVVQGQLVPSDEQLQCFIANAGSFDTNCFNQFGAIGTALVSVWQYSILYILIIKFYATQCPKRLLTIILQYNIILLYTHSLL